MPIWADILLSLAVALIPALASFAGVVISNRKTAALMEYRIGQLEQKVEKHNNNIERTYILEGKMNEVQHDIRDLKGAKA